MRESIVGAIVIAAATSALAGCHAEVKVKAPEPPPAPVEYSAEIKAMTAKQQVIRSVANPNLCIDVAGDDASQHALVRLARCRANEAQRFSFGPGADGAVQIGAVGGLCIDMPAAPPGPYPTYTQLLLCNGAKIQQFKFYVDGRIRELGSNKCITAGGLKEPSPLVPTPCDVGNAAQVWSVDPR